MKILWNAKDGGVESKVWCYGVESKLFGSILLLNFKEGSREAYHSHAFDAISWVLKGKIKEVIAFESDGLINYYKPSVKPIKTYKETFHKVYGLAKNTWILSFRGKWDNEWFEENENGYQTLTHGRNVVSTVKGKIY